ncbi:MAG: M3 family oligoendopeptidase [Candidatus Neomarinimicrobiota bacterium]
MTYNDFHYERLDLEKSKHLINEIISDFKNAKSANKQIEAIKKVDSFSRDYMTYQAMASLNFSRDINDVDAKAEKKYYDSISPDMTELYDRFDKALHESKFKQNIIDKYGNTFLNQIEISLKTFDSKIKNLLKREIELKNDYTKLTAGAKIKYEGKDYNLAGLGPFHSDTNRDIRKKSYEARYRWFKNNEQELDNIYDKLVKLRHKIAVTLGYENFIKLGYDRMGRSDYGPEEVSTFRKQIVEQVVPIVSKLHDQKKDILGLDKLYFYDGINFRDGDPKPKGTPNELIKSAQEMYHELSPETGDFFDKMVNEELMDLVNRDGKRPGGFCTSFPKYDRPYIFSNFNGTDHDITVLTHEAGHAFQNYSSTHLPLVNYHWPTMEAAEIHSMSMEFFTWPWMKKFFKEDTEKFKYKHISGSLSFLPYGACVDHFQHWVYENPEVLPKERKDKWLELESIYMPWRAYDDMVFIKHGGVWQGQLHIYQMPFYYIDYTLAQTCAFQFWIKNEKDHDSAWQDYLNLCHAGGSLSFVNLVKLAKLNSPFEDGCLENVVKYVNNWLENFDIKSV